MKKITFIFLIILFSTNAYSQKKIDWIYSFGGPSNGYFNIHLNDNDFYFMGHYGQGQDFDFSPSNEFKFSDATSSYFGIALAKYDINGDLLWAKQTRLFSNTISYTNSVIQNQNIYAIGHLSTSFNANLNPNSVHTLNNIPGSIQNAFITKYDLNGNIVKAQIIKSSFFSRLSKIIADRFGNLYVIGSYRGVLNFDINGNSTTNTATSVGNEDNAFIIKMDNNFNVLYYKVLGSNSHTYFNDMAVDSKGNIYVTGMFTGSLDINPGSAVQLVHNNTNNFASFVIKLNTQGVYQWGYGIDAHNRAVVVDNEDNFYIGGELQWTANFGLGGAVANFTSGIDTHGNYFANDFVAKYSPNAHLLWIDMTPEISYSSVKTLKIRGDEIYAIGQVAGTKNFSNNENRNFDKMSSFYLKYDKQGNASELFGVTDLVGTNSFSDLTLNNNSMIAYGGFNETGGTVYNLNESFTKPTSPLTFFLTQYLFRIINTTSYNEFDKDISLKIYPNPTVNHLIIDVSEKLMGADYEIFDVSGKKVNNGILTNRTQKINLQLSTGAYILKISKNGQSYSERFIIK